jgi:hypothetical protein
MFQMSLSMTATPPPTPPPIQRERDPCIRSEAFETIDPGYEKYLRKKRKKKGREAWRQ